MTRRKTQKGFSLMELMIAMMIIAVIATLGFRQFKQYTARAHYLQSQDTVKTVREGLDQYYLKHGRYPDISGFEAMVDSSSPLVKENLIPVGVRNRDGFDQPFEAKSGRTGYEITCEGDPNNQTDFGKFTESPGVISTTGGTQKTTTAAPAGEPAAAKPEK